MRRFLLNISVLAIALVFLLSFTGVRLLIHHCLSCETTEMSILGISLEDGSGMHRDHAEQCHIPGHGEDSDIGTGCCDTQENESSCGDCCESEVQYLNNDTRVPYERAEIKVVPVEFELSFTSLLKTGTDEITPASLTLYQRPDRAPPRLSGRDFVIYSHSLKIS